MEKTIQLTKFKITDSELATVLKARLLSSGENARSLNVSTDSRVVQEGDLFFALKGKNFDGHDYVRKCVDKKCWVVVSKKWWRQNSITKNVFVVESPLESLCLLAQYRGLKYSIPKIAITGSNGKSTTKELLVYVLSNQKKVCGTFANFNNEIGVSKTLLSMNEEHKVAIFELGMNQPGEISKLSKMVNPTMAAITNIGEGHIGFFKNLRDICLEKLSITDGLKGILFLNVDDLYLKMSKYELQKTVGIRAGNVRAFDLSCNEKAQYSFQVQGHNIKLKMLGKHSIYNALMVFAICEKLQTVLDLDLDQVAKDIGKFSPVSLRGQRFTVKRVSFYNDCYNANPSSMLVGLNTFVEIKTEGRKIAILGTMQELGKLSKKKHLEVGKSLPNQIDFLIAIGEYCDYYKKGALKAGIDKEKIFMFETKEEALKKLLELAQYDDSVFIKASRTVGLEFIAQQFKLRYEK